LIHQLREANRLGQKAGYNSMTTGRMLKEISLDEPIRYGINDPIEKWLNELLCLNATSDIESL
jgi:N-acetyltransferase 10